MTTEYTEWQRPLSDVTTEYREWKRPLSDVHSIMMKKLAKASVGGGCTPTLFHYIYHHVQVVVYAPAERADTPPISNIPLYVLCGSDGRKTDKTERWNGGQQNRDNQTGSPPPPSGYG